VKTQNRHKSQTYIPPTGFEPAIPVSEKPQTLVLNRAVTGIGHIVINAHTNCGRILQCIVSIGTIKTDLIQQIIKHHGVYYL